MVAAAQLHRVEGLSRVTTVGLSRRKKIVFTIDPRVRYVNLGRTIDIHDTSLVYDGIHVVARGNQILADALAPTLLEMIK